MAPWAWGGLIPSNYLYILTHFLNSTYNSTNHVKEYSLLSQQRRYWW